VNNRPILVTPNSFNVPARLGLAMATMQDSRVILDQNGEVLTPPGQAILVRGMEIVKVMPPYRPDDERAQQLNALRLGQVELTELEKKTLLAARNLCRRARNLQPAPCTMQSKAKWIKSERRQHSNTCGKWGCWRLELLKAGLPQCRKIRLRQIAAPQPCGAATKQHFWRR